MTADHHATAVEHSFRRQADAFEDASRNQVFTVDARWVFDALPRSPDDLVLDVAAGTGHAARQLAPSVRAVVALDATEAMLVRGQAAARQAGVGNVAFMRHGAERLPFLDGSFDIAVCRFALHHMERPAEVVAEMARCTRPGGHVALVDLIGDRRPEVAARQDRLERLRDPSHARLLTEDELRGLLSGCGCELVDLTTRPLQRPLGPWLAQTATSDAATGEISAALEAELHGGPLTGFQPRRDGEGLRFTQTFAAAVGRRV